MNDYVISHCYPLLLITFDSLGVSSAFLILPVSQHPKSTWAFTFMTPRCQFSEATYRDQILGQSTLLHRTLTTPAAAVASVSVDMVDDGGTNNSVVLGLACPFPVVIAVCTKGGGSTGSGGGIINEGSGDRDRKPLADGDGTLNSSSKLSLSVPYDDTDTESLQETSQVHYQ
jgi:hypothetical protein